MYLNTFHAVVSCYYHKWEVFSILWHIFTQNTDENTSLELAMNFFPLQKASQHTEHTENVRS